MDIPRIVIAGTHSGVGKSTVALGLMSALIRKGYKVQPFKVGPDFLDPLHHSRITGRTSRNLDGWMLSREYVMKTFQNACDGADIAVIEGVMGLFDGKEPSTETASTAEMAKWLQAPVVLVVDATGMARSLKAHLQGFKNFDQSLHLSGVIFNRVSSQNHLQWLKTLVEDDLPSLGGIIYDKRFHIPERHLGLTHPESTFSASFKIDTLVQTAESFLDLKEIINLSQSASPLLDVKEERKTAEACCKIAVAQDEAFHFYYQDNLDLLQREGAELIPFSPIHDGKLPEGIQGIYIGGGYPELFVKELSKNQPMKDEIREFIKTGGPTYAECGGLMFLSNEIRVVSGKGFEMVGIVPGYVQMNDKLAALGYTDIGAIEDNPILKKGEKAKGHVFHYSCFVRDPRKKDDYGLCYRILGDDNERTEGYYYKNLVATYVHLHFGSNPGIAKRFVEQCQSWEIPKKLKKDKS